MTFALIFTADGVIQGVVDFKDIETDIWSNWINWSFIEKQL